MYRHGKTRLNTWTTAENGKTIYRHTKRICKGTIFIDEDTVWRVVETKSRARYQGRTTDVVTYCDHFRNCDADPPLNECEVSSYAEVREWHKNSRAELMERKDLQPRTGMQNTEKTMQIYERDLYPVMQRLRLVHLV